MFQQLQPLLLAALGACCECSPCRCPALAPYRLEGKAVVPMLLTTASTPSISCLTASGSRRSAAAYCRARGVRDVKGHSSVSCLLQWGAPAGQRVSCHGTRLRPDASPRVDGTHWRLDVCRLHARVCCGHRSLTCRFGWSPNNLRALSTLLVTALTLKPRCSQHKVFLPSDKDGGCDVQQLWCMLASVAWWTCGVQAYVQ
jgi:hypothetical protein